MTDHVIRSLDGAHRDYAASGDAMRWKPPPMIVDPPVASVATGIPVRTIQRWVLRGLLTDHGDGQRLLVDVDAVQTLAETRRNGRLPNSHPTVA